MLNAADCDQILKTPAKAKFRLDGEIARRLNAVTDQWILPAPFANPAMLEMFRNRDRKPYQDQVPWAGEFAGKYLTHAVQIYRLTRDAKLGAHIRWFVGEFVALQAENGYLGPWPREWELRQGAPNCKQPWDAWGHYHAMIGLLLWHLDSGDQAALACARRIGDLFCDRFLDGRGETLHDAGAQEMNQAPIHALALLHRLTGEKRYLDMARQIEREFEIPPAGDYLRTALAGKEFWETPKPRWESLHPIMGLVELYYSTGDVKYRQAFEHLWWSMLKGDRHNNGGFTSGEKATGDPYDTGAIETCCTVAWMAMSFEMLRLTGNAIVADELELSMFNSGLGMMSPSGRWVTYNTPMDGPRRASAHDIVFQARPGSPELNCCSVNGPRALGMLCEWAVMERADGLALNYYGPGVMDTPRARLTLTTEYPLENDVTICVQPRRKNPFTIALRIPHWSERTTVKVNGAQVSAVVAGRYLELTRAWQRGDTILLTLDFRAHVWTQGPLQGARDLELPWRLFGPVPRTARESEGRKPPEPVLAPALEGLTEIPAQMIVNGQSYAPIPAISKGGILAFRELFPGVGGAPVAFGFAEWQVEEDQEMQVFFAADWWIAWYVNGTKVFDNHATRGTGNDFHLRRSVVRFTLRKGRNLIAIRLSGGATHGCWLSAGRDMTRAEMAAKPVPAMAYSTAIYRGPLLLAYDPRYNPVEAESMPALDGRAPLSLRRVNDPTWLKPWLLLEVTAADGSKVRLCDFASAGAAGNAYASWLPVIFPPPVDNRFSTTNPLRSRRA